MMRVFLKPRFNKVLVFLISVFIIYGSFSVVSSEELMEQESVEYFKEGLAAQSADKIDEAISLYSKAIYANPNYVQAYNNLGTAYAQKGDIVKAEELYNHAVTIDPYYSIALKNIAIIYAEKGDYEKFYEYWKRASGLDVYCPFIIDDQE
jgi:tetratricopeptide (TPR) repeat protein